MTMTKTLIGTNANGTPKYHYEYNGHPDGGILLTGQVAGIVYLKDGTSYDVTPEAIEHAPGHAGPICHYIELIHEETGLLGPDFKHVCSDFCGPEATIPPATAP